MLPWQQRPECNWDTGNWTGLSVSTNQLSPTMDLHSMVDTEEVKGAIMLVPKLEIDKLGKSKRRQKLLPELQSSITDRLCSPSRKTAWGR